MATTADISDLAINGIACLIISILSGCAASAAMRDWRALALETAASAPDIASVDSSRSAIPSPAQLSAVGQLSAAMVLARQAAAATALQRPLLLARAEAQLRSAQLARPDWGQASVVDAYLTGVRTGRADARTNALFARSYSESPFLRAEGEWRVRYGLAQWQNLDAKTREHVLGEACWMARFSTGWRTHMGLLLSGTPAEAQFRATLVELAR